MLMNTDNLAEDKRVARRYRIEGLEGRIPLVTFVEIVNVSLGGAALKVDRRLNLGSECVLRLQQGDDAVSVKGHVVWSALTGFRGHGGDSSPEYSVGMCFTDMVGPNAAALLGLIDQNRTFKQQTLCGSVEVVARGRAMLDKPRPFQVKLISSAGMLIEMNIELDVGDRYVMVVRLDELTPIHVTGCVSSQFEMGPDRHEIGIEFDEISGGDRALLKSLLQSRKG
jgi:hypothetical protein